MSDLKRIQKLIQQSTASWRRYEKALEANESDFGAQLMVGNIKRHLADLERQMLALAPAQSLRTSMDNNPMAASAM